jgi:hypothetical protein
MQTYQDIRLPRYASDAGETLVVRDFFGIKALVDPTDDTVAVIVPTGRRVNLIRFAFAESVRSYGRDLRATAITIGAHLGFAAVCYPGFTVFLRDLPEGQLVDVLPAADPAAAYAALLRPLPVLYGAVAVQPEYAAVAA